MPTNRVELTHAGFLQFKAWMEKVGFREVSREEARTNTRHFRLVSPRNGEGGAVSFTFSANGLEVVVWTTYRRDLGRGTETGLGWVVITNEGRRTRLHVRRPTRRTKNFWKNLYMRARASRRVVMAVPLCPKCGVRMAITRGRGIGARYFKCPNRDNHIGEKLERLSFDDVGHHPKVMRFILKERAAKKRTRNDSRLKGKKPVRLTRKRWGKTEPSPTYP